MSCEITVKQQAELQKLRLRDPQVGLLATDIVESLDGARIRDVETTLWELEALCRRLSTHESMAAESLMQFLTECGDAQYLTMAAAKHFCSRVEHLMAG